MTDKRFRITPEMPKNWVDIIDTDNNRTLCNIRIEYADNMIKLLNELHEENNELRLQLNQCSDQRNEFHRGARENAHRVGKLKKENEQLKKEVEYLQNMYLKDMQKKRNEIKQLQERLENESEQLKERNNRQAKQLDELYNLIENEDWQTLKGIMQEFQECEEQLQRESGTYGDGND